MAKGGARGVGWGGPVENVKLREKFEKIQGQVNNSPRLGSRGSPSNSYPFYW